MSSNAYTCPAGKHLVKKAGNILSFFLVLASSHAVQSSCASLVSARRSRHTLGCPDNYSLVLRGADRPLASELNAWLWHHKPCMA